MHKNFDTMFKEAHIAGRELASCAAVVGGQMDGLPGAVAAAMAPVAGALHVVAMALAPRDQIADGEDFHASADQMTFAGLFTLACIGNGNGLDFQPATFVEAFHWYEKLTGKKPDTLVLDAFAKVAREAEKDGAVPLAAFMEARRNGTTH